MKFLLMNFFFYEFANDGDGSCVLYLCRLLLSQMLLQKFDILKSV